METARKPENSDDDYSQSFEEDEHLNISSGSEGQRTSGFASITRARRVDRGRVNAAAAFSNGKSADGGTRRGGGSRLRAAVRTVQTMQTVTKTFSNSQQVRDAVYQEWLTKKSTALKSSQELLHEERRKKEAAVKKQNETRAERLKTALQEWQGRKKIELVEKQKQMKEQAKEKEMEEEDERGRRRQVSEVVFNQWKKQKDQRMLKEQRQRKLEEERGRQEKEMEDEENTNYEMSKKVIESWIQHKDEVMKDNARKTRQEKRQKLKTEAAEKARKAEKESKAREERKRYLRRLSRTRAESATPRPAWCPARTLHSVPSPRLCRIQTTREQFLSSRKTRVTECEERYSQDSFSVAESTSSEESGGEREAEMSRGSSSGHLPSDSAANCTGTLKTVQVCCKTLEYWCNCDHR